MMRRLARLTGLRKARHARRRTRTPGRPAATEAWLRAHGELPWRNP